jgi:hypothetical protein
MIIFDIICFGVYCMFSIVDFPLYSCIESYSPWRTDTANQRGGEWMGVDKNSSRRRWRLQQDEHNFQHTSLNLGTNSQPHRPENTAEHKTRVHWPTLVRQVSTTGQTGPCWWKQATSTEIAPQRSGRCNTPVRPVSAGKPQNTKQAYRVRN